MKASWRQPVQDRAADAVRWIGMQRAGVGLPLRIVGYAGIWWIITGGEGGWLWGLPAVLVAALFNPFPTTDHRALALALARGSRVRTGVRLAVAA